MTDCTEVFTEKPSDRIAQEAIWSDKKSSIQVLVGLPPVGFPRFVSYAFPGSISDDNISAQSEILSLTRENKR